MVYLVYIDYKKGEDKAEREMFEDEIGWQQKEGDFGKSEREVGNNGSRWFLKIYQYRFSGLMKTGLS